MMKDTYVTLMTRRTTVKDAKMIPLEEMHRWIVEGRYRKEVDEINKARENGDTTLDKDGNVVPLCKVLKDKLPYCVVAGNVTKRRKLEGFCNPTGRAVVDIDHVTPEELARTLAWLREQTWVKEIHRSCSGEGVHAIVNLGIIPQAPNEPGKDGFTRYVSAENEKAYTKEYKRRYTQVTDYIQQECNVECDHSCSDVLRGFYPSVDADAFIRPDEEVTEFSYVDAPTTTTADKKADTKSASATHKPEQPAGEVSTDMLRDLYNFLMYNMYKPSGRHAWWIKLGSYLKRKGVDQEQMPQMKAAMARILKVKNLIQADDPLLRDSDEVDNAMQWGYEMGEAATNSGETIDLWLDSVDDTEDLGTLCAIRLPEALQATLAPQPDAVKIATIAGVMPLAMAHATNVSVRYCDGKLMRLNGMTCVIARQGGLKSGVKDMVLLWRKPMDALDKEARRIEDEHREKVKTLKSTEKRPPMPKVRVFCVTPTVSCSTLLRRLKNADGMHIFSFSEEIDTISKTNGAGAWSQKYDLYRLSFENGEWGQDYNSEQSESGVANVAYNWTFMGTPQAVLRCFLGNGSVENGLAARVDFAVIPPEYFAHMPKYKEPKAEHQEAIERGVKILQTAGGFVETPRLCKAIEKWCNDKADEASRYNDKVMDTFRKRAAIIGFRYGVVFHILEQGEAWIASGKELTQDFMKDAKESKQCVRFAELMAERVMRTQCILWGGQLEDDQKKMASSSGHYNSRNKSLLTQLPDEFTYQMVAELNPDKGYSTLRSIISRWGKKGLVECTDTNSWKKTRKGCAL